MGLPHSKTLRKEWCAITRQRLGVRQPMPLLLLTIRHRFFRLLVSWNWRLTGSGVYILISCVFHYLKHFHCGVVTGDAADGATAACTGAADEYVGEFSFDAPGSDGFGGFGERKSQRTMKDVAAVMAEFAFDVERGFGFKAGFAIASARKAILDWLGEITVQSVKAFLRSLTTGEIVVRIE